MDDLINREEAIDEWKNDFKGYVNALNIPRDDYRGIMNYIDELPSAEPVRHGKWIGYAGTIGNECSVCAKWIDVLQGTAEMNYCPNCGARMDKE